MPRRVDENQTEIVLALRKMGVKVAITSELGKGFPDLVISCSGHLCMIEVKDGEKPLSHRKLTPAEQKFHNTWSEHVYIIESVAQAINFVKEMRLIND